MWVIYQRVQKVFVYQEQLYTICMYYIIVYISTQLITSRRRRIKYVWMIKYISNSKYRDENHHDTHYN